VHSETPLPQVLAQKYTLVGMVGYGQYGRVLQCRRRSDGYSMALKELPAAGLTTQAFLKEVNLLFVLAHPRVVRCEAIEHGDRFRYLVLEYCEGGTLRNLMADGGLSLPQRLSLMIQVLEGLAFAHSHQVVHCDLKPENLLLRPMGKGWQIKISDFGISRLVGEHSTHHQGGSPAYMAPEQFSGQTSPQSDLYALGVILYELMLGRRPFQGPPGELMRAHQNKMPIFPKYLPEPLTQFLQQALAKDPTQRFQSAQSMAVALSQFYKTLTALNAPPGLLCHAPAFKGPYTPSSSILAPSVLDTNDLDREIQAIALSKQWVYLAQGRALQRKSIEVTRTYALPQAIESLHIHEDTLYAQTPTALYRWPSEALDQLQVVYEHSTPCQVDIFKNNLVIGQPGAVLRLDISNPEKPQILQKISVRSYAFAPMPYFLEERLMVIAGDGKGIISIFDQAGNLEGEDELPHGAHRAWKNRQHGILLLHHFLEPKTVTLLKPEPFCVRPIVLPSPVLCACPVKDGFAIATADAQLYIVSLKHKIKRILLPRMVTALVEGNNRNLVVAMGTQIYSFDLALESIDKSLGKTEHMLSNLTKLTPKSIGANR
jgi:serine/threonine protein kinase